MPREELSSADSQPDMVFKEEATEGSFEQSMFALKVMQNEIRELAGNMVSVKKKSRKRHSPAGCQKKTMKWIW